MSVLFRRQVIVIVDDLQVKDLRMTFKVTKTLKKEPNSCVATITNLAQGTRSAMRSKGAKLSVLAGYDGRVQEIFSGKTRRINHLHERPEWTTTIECGDGEQEFLWSRVSSSFSAGTKWRDVVHQVGKALLENTGNLEEKLRPVADQFVNGYTAHGRASVALDKLLKGKNLEWSIQDGRLQVLSPGEHNTDDITVLSPDTGLVGSPEFGSADKKSEKQHLPDVLKAKMFLMPHLRCGSRVRVNSRQIKGDFMVTELHHSGDTSGDEFYTEIEATAVKG
jgi:hypothetical protein